MDDTESGTAIAGEPDEPTAPADGRTPPRGDKRRVRQAAARARYDRAALHAVLDACPIGHVAFVADGWPQSIPTAIARLDDALYLHGSRSSRLYRHLAAGGRVAISACTVDALVKARSAFHCTMNYRSAVVFGTGDPVAAEDKPVLLDRFTERLIPGSSGDFRPYLAKELRATELVRVGLEEASVKIRTGGPIDDPGDEALPHWAGVIPLETRRGEPIDADDLPADVVIQAARTRAVASPSMMSRTASSAAGSASGATGLEK